MQILIVQLVSLLAIAAAEPPAPSLFAPSSNNGAGQNSFGNSGGYQSNSYQQNNLNANQQQQYSSTASSATSASYGPPSQDRPPNYQYQGGFQSQQNQGGYQQPQRNQGSYNQPQNQGYQPQGNQGYQPQQGNQGYQQQGNQGYQQQGNQGYQQPGNQGYQQPGNQDYQQNSNQGYQPPANSGGYQSQGQSGYNQINGQGQRPNHSSNSGGYESENPMPYNFAYAVKDSYGNDYQRQEASDGSVVNGQYRVLLPDGRTQIVRYTADWQNGFNAQVTYEGEARYPDQNQNNGASYGAPGQTNNGYGAPASGPAPTFNNGPSGNNAPQQNYNNVPQQSYNNAPVSTSYGPPQPAPAAIPSNNYGPPQQGYNAPSNDNYVQNSNRVPNYRNQAQAQNRPYTAPAPTRNNYPSNTVPNANQPIIGATQGQLGNQGGYNNESLPPSSNYGQPQQTTGGRYGRSPSLDGGFGTRLVRRSRQINSILG